jgi:hypothetical protein
MNLIIKHNNTEIHAFAHAYKGTRSTVVLEKPDVSMLMQKIRQLYTDLTPPKVVVNIGCSKAHPKDPYNKKVGRDLATSRMKPIEMQIENPNPYTGLATEGHLCLILTGIDTELNVYYSLNVKIYKDSLQLRVMGCFTRSWE